MKVEDLDADDEIIIKHEALSGVWRVSDVGVEEAGLFTIPYATIVQDGAAWFLVGNTTATDGKTIQVRPVEEETVEYRVAPEQVIKA